jgi:hypothetical protein
MVFRLMRRPRSKPPPNLWQFGLDVQEVMAARISRAMNGTLSAGEARRMVAEKQSASMRAPLAYARELLKGGPASANRAFFDTYHEVVRSNRERLRKRRTWF